jgi:molecular chaperone GrpE
VSTEEKVYSGEDTEQLDSAAESGAEEKTAAGEGGASGNTEDVKEQESGHEAGEGQDGPEAADGKNESDAPETEEEKASGTGEEENASETGKEEKASETGEETDPGTGEDEPGAEKAAKGEKDGFFGRKYKKELAKKEEELNALKDRYMRTLAEYENFRKRTEKEKADIYTYAVKDVMTKMLPVLDNLERGLALIPEESKADPVAEGMDKICRQFQKTLQDIGVKPIEAEGKEFDPNLHNAVMHVEDENLGENIVAEELQKGYTYKDSVVRHSMVKVAN